MTINSGTVTAEGGSNGAGIGGGNGGAGGTSTINGGTVTGHGGEHAAGIGGGSGGNGGTVVINGGTVTATGDDDAAGIGGGFHGDGGTVTISGGTVTATGGEGAAGIGGASSGASGTFTTTASGTGLVCASSIQANGDKANWRGVIVEGSTDCSAFTPTATKGIYELNKDLSVLSGQTLTVGGDKVKVVVPHGKTLTGALGSTITAQNKGQILYLTGGTITIHGTQNTPTGGVIGEGARYLDEHGTMQIIPCTHLETNTVSWADGTCHYVQNPNQAPTTLTIDQRITANGKVTLILADKTTLNANSGINVGTGKELTIYGQSTGGDKGTLVAKGGENQAGIGGSEGTDGGTVVIIGGHVKATGGKEAAGIGGGKGGHGDSITIIGGIVEARGTDGGSGIGGGDARGGTFTTSIGSVKGNALICVSYIDDKSHMADWTGVILKNDGSCATIKGQNGTYEFATTDPVLASSEKLIIGGQGVSLTIPSGATWDNQSDNATVQNDGRLIVAGNVTPTSKNTKEETGGKVIPREVTISDVPQLKSRTDTSITLTPVAGVVYCQGQTCQDSPTFTGLNPATSYTFDLKKKPLQYYITTSNSQSFDTQTAAPKPPAAKPTVYVKPAAGHTGLALTGADTGQLAILALIALVLGGALLAPRLMRRSR